MDLQKKYDKLVEHNAKLVRWIGEVQRGSRTDRDLFKSLIAKKDAFNNGDGGISFHIWHPDGTSTHLSADYPHEDYDWDDQIDEPICPDGEECSNGY